MLLRHKYDFDNILFFFRLVKGRIIENLIIYATLYPSFGIFDHLHNSTGIYYENCHFTRFAEGFLTVKVLLHIGQSTSIPSHSSSTCKSFWQCGHFVINSAITQFLFLLQFEQKKRHIPKKCPSLRLVQRCNIHKTGMCHAIIHGHTDSKSILQYAFFLKYQFRDGRLQSVCQIFYSVFVFYTSVVFSEMQHALRLTIIYHSE